LVVETDVRTTGAVDQGHVEAALEELSQRFQHEALAEAPRPRGQAEPDRTAFVAAAALLALLIALVVRRRRR
jgi:hypothetical protein